MVLGAYCEFYECVQRTMKSKVVDSSKLKQMYKNFRSRSSSFRFSFIGMCYERVNGFNRWNLQKKT